MRAVRADAAGYLNGPVLDVGGVPIQVGDKVMMLRNDRKIGVRNGHRGIVVEVDPEERTIRVQLHEASRTCLPATSTLATSVSPTR